MLADPLRSGSHRYHRSAGGKRAIQQFAQPLSHGIRYAWRLNRVAHISRADVVRQVRHVLEVANCGIEVLSAAQMPFGVEHAAELAPVAETDAAFHAGEVR